MTVALAVLLFFALVLAWIALPFAPTWREARRRTDAQPLRVVREEDVDVRHFARGLRAFVARRLGREVAECRASGLACSGTLPGGQEYAVLPPGDVPELRPAATGPAVCAPVLVTLGDLRLPPASLFPAEVYVEGALRGGYRNIYRAVLAEGTIELEAESWVLRWLHAGGDLDAAAGCVLGGRASADGALRLAVGCCYERLHAARLEFGPDEGGAAAAPAGRPDDGAATGREPAPLTAAEVPRLVDDAAGRWLIAGRCELPAGRLAPVDLVVTGSARIGRGARLAGAVKSRGDLVLEDGVEVLGAVVAGRDLHAGAGCRIHGPVIAERDARLGPGCRVGGPELPTTVSARRLEIAAGTVVHGTVWAHAGGRVIPAAAEPGRRVRGGRE